MGVVFGFVKEKKDWIFVVFFAAVLYAFSAITCTPRMFTDDDWGIANYFAGVMGAEYATPYNKFVNFILGWIMYGMYQLIPGPNWFVVVQEILVMVSFALFQYMLIAKMKEYISVGWSYGLTSVFLFSFAPSYICRLQYSQTAALGSIIGMCWMIFCYYVKSRKGFWVGVVLTSFSALFRLGSYELCLPFAGMYLLSYLWTQNYAESRFSIILKGLKKDIKLFLSIAGIFAGVLVVSKINGAIYNADYYAEYNAFNTARASFIDYYKAPYEDIADKLQEIGVSKNDYELMSSWTFADLSFYTTDLFNKVSAIEPKVSEELDYISQINQYFTKLQDPTIMYNKLFYMALFILVICMFVDTKRMCIFAPLLLVGTVAIEIYFTIIVCRYPVYVRTGLLFALIVVAVLITDFSKIRVLCNHGYVTFAILLAIPAVLFKMGNDYWLTTKGSFEYNMDGLAMYEYMNGREDDIFVIPTGENGGLPSLRNSYSIFKATKPGIMQHVVGLGGWSTNNPWVNEAYQSWGIDYPMSQTADENVYLCASIKKVDSLRTYLKEHHNIDTTASLSAVEYGTTIYKITNNDVLIEEERGTGIISDVRCTYDKIYDTYDVSVCYIVEEPDETENVRLFISLTDSKGDVLTKIPTSMLEENMEYLVNIMVQTEDTNRLVCENEIVLEVKK